MWVRPCSTLQSLRGSVDSHSLAGSCVSVQTADPTCLRAVEGRCEYLCGQSTAVHVLTDPARCRHAAVVVALSDQRTTSLKSNRRVLGVRAHSLIRRIRGISQL